MNAKEFLMRGWRIESRIMSRQGEIQRLRERAETVRSSAPRSGPRGGRRRDWTDALAALADAEARINREIVELCAVQAEISAAIDRVQNVKQRRVLELRYRNYMGWEEIADMIGCDVRTVYRLHGRGLARVTAT